MKYTLIGAFSALLFISSCSNKTYTENPSQTEWVELYDNIALTEDIESVKKRFPAITNWATEEKDNKLYLWSGQTMFDTDAHVAFIFKEKTLFQVKIYLKGLTEDAAEKTFNSLKSTYTEAISSNKQFCNNQNSNLESCFWLLETMTVYLKYVEYDSPLILFGFQKR